MQGYLSSADGQARDRLPASLPVRLADAPQCGVNFNSGQGLLDARFALGTYSRFRLAEYCSGCFLDGFF